VETKIILKTFFYYISHVVIIYTTYHSISTYNSISWRI